jgi:hypothetical protein
MIEAEPEFVSSLSGGRWYRQREAQTMRAFAFSGISEGLPNAIAVSTDIDRDPYLEDWFRQRIKSQTWCTPLLDWMLDKYPSVVTIDSKRFELTPWAGYAAHWSVCRSVKDVIENFEPGKHQFLPVKLRYGECGKFEEHNYFTLQVNAMENAVDIEKSDVAWWELPEGRGRYWRRKALVPVVLPKSSIEGRHLWRNEQISQWMMSGALHDALVQRGLTAGLQFEEQFVV